MECNQKTRENIPNYVTFLRCVMYYDTNTFKQEALQPHK